jgi:hypothetical protein
MGVSPATPAPEIRACSACAGDYEDPDWTAWTDEVAEGEDDGPSSGERPAPEDEFPVPCG